VATPREPAGLPHFVVSRTAGYEEHWPQIEDTMIDSMVRVEKALKPHIAVLPV
jgi:hypothetical protein